MDFEDQLHKDKIIKQAEAVSEQENKTPSQEDEISEQENKTPDQEDEISEQENKTPDQKELTPEEKEELRLQAELEMEEKLKAQKKLKMQKYLIYRDVLKERDKIWEQEDLQRDQEQKEITQTEITLQVNQQNKNIFNKIRYTIKALYAQLLMEIRVANKARKLKAQKIKLQPKEDKTEMTVRSDRFPLLKLQRKYLYYVEGRKPVRRRNWFIPTPILADTINNMEIRNVKEVEQEIEKNMASGELTVELQELKEELTKTVKTFKRAWEKYTLDPNEKPHVVKPHKQVPPWNWYSNYLKEQGRLQEATEEYNWQHILMLRKNKFKDDEPYKDPQPTVLKKKFRTRHYEPSIEAIDSWAWYREFAKKMYFPSPFRDAEERKEMKEALEREEIQAQARLQQDSPEKQSEEQNLQQDSPEKQSEEQNLQQDSPEKQSEEQNLQQAEIKQKIEDIKQTIEEMEQRREIEKTEETKERED